MVQSISTILCVTVQIAVKEWMFSTLPDICERDQPDHLTCPRNRVFYSASAIWYVLNGNMPPKRTDNHTLRVFEQGSCRPHTAIRPDGCLQIFYVRYAHRCSCAYPVLVVATPVPEHPTEIYQLTRHAQRSHTCPTRKRDQLRELVYRWVYLPYVILFYFFIRRFYLFIYGFIYLSCWVSLLGRVEPDWRDAELPVRSLED